QIVANCCQVAYCYASRHATARCRLRHGDGQGFCTRAISPAGQLHYRRRRSDMDYPYDLGSYVRQVATTSPDAQSWFNRGLNWCFGFHHEEAVACFEKARAADTNCAMAHWGVGYAAGPNYNFPWELMDPAGKAAALARA